MNWKFAGDRPVYQQIMAAIRGAILKGELPPGGKVPSVRDLAAQAQVNPNTMQRALQELESRLMSQGASLSDYLQMAGMTEEDLRSHARENALEFARYELAMTEIARQEGITITEEELEEYIRRAEAENGDEDE